MGDKRMFSVVESERLIALGFDPATPVYGFDNPDFNLADVKQALFQSTYQKPGLLPLLSGDPLDGPRLYVVPELIQVTFYVTDGFCGRGNPPNWYVRGYLPQSGLNPTQPLCTVHMELILARIDDPDQVETVNYQLVADAPPTASSRQLVRATGEPLL